MRHVLIDDPQPLAVHRHNKAGAHLPQRLQIRNLIGAWQRRRRISIRTGQIPHPVRRLARAASDPGSDVQATQLKLQAAAPPVSAAPTSDRIRRRSPRPSPAQFLPSRNRSARGMPEALPPTAAPIPCISRRKFRARRRHGNIRTSCPRRAHRLHPPAAAVGKAGNRLASRISACRIASRVKSCTNCGCRKRTSIFAGCTFTSTSSYGMSRNSSVAGKTPAGTILRYAS